MCRRMTLRTAGRVAAQESAQSLTRQFSVAASARAFLLEMQQARVACNVLHYNASIIACHRSSEWENALDFFVEMQQRNLQQDQALSWRALCLFSNMCRRRIQADSTCSSGVRACDLGSKWTSALKFLALARQLLAEIGDGLHRATEGGCEPQCSCGRQRFWCRKQLKGTWRH